MEQALSEQDARKLTRQITESLFRLGAKPTRMGVALDRGGFSFTADLHGRQVTVQTGEGNFTYDAIAKELLIRALDPAGDWGARFWTIDGKPVTNGKDSYGTDREESGRSN